MNNGCAYMYNGISSSNKNKQMSTILNYTDELH